MFGSARAQQGIGGRVGRDRQIEIEIEIERERERERERVGDKKKEMKTL